MQQLDNEVPVWYKVIKIDVIIRTGRFQDMTFKHLL